MDEVLNNYHEAHEVEYVMTVKIDGVLIAKATSGISADDLVGDAHKLDDAVQKHIMSELTDAAEYAAEAQAEAQMQEQLDNQ